MKTQNIAHEVSTFYLKERYSLNHFKGYCNIIASKPSDDVDDWIAIKINDYDSLRYLTLTILDSESMHYHLD